jgi:hypothetical protein
VKLEKEANMSICETDPAYEDTKTRRKVLNRNADVLVGISTS